VWWGSEDMELISEIVEEFKAEHADEATFQITISDESVDTCRETVLSNPKAAADIFTFADDQLDDLWRGGALLEITENTAAVIEANGGESNGACRASMRDGKLYAYPVTAGNGYFLYYNSSYFTEEDVKSLDRILEISAENGKKATMDFTSGWYIYSFFKGAGLELGLNEDGVSNYCTWNSDSGKYKGTDVAEAMLAIAAHEGFMSADNDTFLKGVKDDSIIAGINGAWNAVAVAEKWGDDYAAVKLPCYTLAGDSVQMCSFSGYKLVGVNTYSSNQEWAMRLAEKITNEQSQMKRFELLGECPSNIKAAQSAEVQSAPAIAALFEQSEYAYTQSVADTFWNPSYIFGITIAGGNPDNKPLQELLDTMVREATAVPETDGSAEAE
ncbi:MAG: extracellular solute-binding protein, partial [Oscillospiraceae bacterium]|nr:extracellular solute-binding protein [Oscillospiraceae bacterium]